MLFAVFFAIALIFIVLGVVFACGKGAGLIAGYNTSSPEEKAKTDEKKLLKAVSVLMFVLSGCFMISAAGGLFGFKPLIWAGQALAVISVAAGLIYFNTGDRFKKR
ncbi:MAG: DUF3784 domain-containing protein [Clostridia bacterium]|nr:DUF3784 domain-containing protein [Clostridia bacterium]